VKWPLGQKQLDHGMGYTFSLISYVTKMVINQSKRYLVRDSFTLRRCGCAECMGSQVIWFAWL